jgi:hypothetical protein
LPLAIAPTLRHPIALGVFGVCGSPLAPVIAVIGGPDPLRPRLVGAVILVALALVLLPAPPPLTLTSRLTAIQLPGDCARGRNACSQAAQHRRSMSSPPRSQQSASLDAHPKTKTAPQLGKGVTWVSSNEQTRVNSRER